MFFRRKRSGRTEYLQIDRRPGRGDQFFGVSDVRLAGGAGEQSIVANAVEAFGQKVEQEAPDEFIGRQRHRAEALPAVAAVILVAERHTALVEAHQPAVRYGDAVGVAAFARPEAVLAYLARHC